MEMSRDAAKRFRELVATGEEIPYDMREAGDGSPLPQYVPLTERFVRDHAAVLRELDSFGSACAAIESAGLAGPYLTDSGVAVPHDPRERAELAGIVFLARMWLDSTDFSLDEGRLRAGTAELEAHADAGEGEIEVVVPLRGLRMEGTQLKLATATIVRADTVEVPAEARASEASGGAGWEPTFLAVAAVPAAGDSRDQEGAEPDAGIRPVKAFRELITTLRLFKPGGVALGPHAWTRVGGGRWRRISTGAGRPRPGGYLLAETELSALVAFSHAVNSRMGATGEATPRAGGGVGRAITRFEAGLERTVALDALNDYLLALRFLLEGGGPASLGLPMRVASLCAEPDERSQVKAVIDRALALERELWSGEPPAGTAEGPTPAETALEVEELTRAILKDAACGHLGADLRATADEILLADGLAVGDGAAGQRGETAEWSAGPAEDLGEDADIEEEPVAAPEAERAAEPVAEPFEWVTPTEAGDDEAGDDVAGGPRYGRDAPVVPTAATTPDREHETGEREREVEVIHHPQRITVARTIEEETRVMDTEPAREQMPDAGDSPVVKLLALHADERERTASRVANLFPAPETTEWNVREISYDRTRRAAVSDRAS